MRNHRRRGLTLVDVLIALSLLGVFALLAFRLLGANFNLTAATMQANDNAARFDDALRQLRADVSDSSSLEMPEPGVLRIHGPGPQLVEWKSDHDNLTRKLGNQNRQWNLEHPVALKLDGEVVLLIADSAEPIAMTAIHPQSKGGPR